MPDFFKAPDQQNSLPDFDDLQQMPFVRNADSYDHEQWRTILITGHDDLEIQTRLQELTILQGLSDDGKVSKRREIYETLKANGFPKNHWYTELILPFIALSNTAWSNMLGALIELVGNDLVDGDEIQYLVTLDGHIEILTACMEEN